MAIQSKISHLDHSHKIARPKNSLSDSEKFYKNVKVIHHSDIKFPGRFGKKKENCGQFKFAYSCYCGNLTKAILNYCNNVNCPKCYIMALRRSAKRISYRLKRIKDFKRYKKHERKPFFNHIVIAPEEYPEEMNYHEFQKWKERYLKVIRKYNGSGVLFFHAYRLKRITVPWKTDHTKLREITVLRYHPHFHLIGNIWIPRSHFETEKFVIKKVRHKAGHKKEGQIIKLYRTKHYLSLSRYLLSHTTYYENTHMTSWIGKYSYRKLKQGQKEITYDVVICKMCDEPAYKIDSSPMDVDNDFYYFSPYWKSYLDLDFPPLRKKIIMYDLYENS